MGMIRFPPGTPLDDIFDVIKALSTLPADTDIAIIKAIEALANGSLASDKQLLDLITAVIERVTKLEAIEAQRYEQYMSLVRRQAELVELATKAINELEALGKQFFKNKQKDIH